MQPRQSNKDMRLRTKPLRDDFGAPWTQADGPLMAAGAGGQGSGKLHVGIAKAKKGWCRITPTTTAEPDKSKKPSRASRHGQKQPSQPFVREPIGVCPLPGCVEKARRTESVKLDAGGGVRRDRKHPF